MIDHSVFDTLLDAVVILDGQKNIVYANDAFLTLCNLSMRKVKAGLRSFDAIHFEDTDFFCMPNGILGRDDPSPYREVKFESPSGKSGRAQVTIQPAGPDRWIVYMRDTGLEETLHSKYRAELAMKEIALSELQQAHRSLEDYSKNLEKKVQDRTAELHTANQLLSAMIDSLGQGFLIFRQDGRCLPVYSRACEQIFLQSPSHCTIEELLHLSGEEQRQFKLWSQALFEERIPFPDLAALGPKLFSHPFGNRITLEYAPLRGEKDQVEGIILVATDVTREYQATLAAQAEREHVALILKLVRNKRQFVLFIKEAFATLDRIEPLLNSGTLANLDIEDALRSFHTIKGGAALFLANDAKKAAHEMEDLFTQLREDPEASLNASANVSSEASSDASSLAHRLKASLEAVREGLTEFFKKNKDIIGREISDCEPSTEIAIYDLLRFLDELKGMPESQRLQELFTDSFIREPISKQFTHVSEFVCELAESQGKKVHPLRITGGEIRVDPNRYRDFFQALMHAFRNAVDHGLDSPQERMTQGKDPAGLITVECSWRGGGGGRKLEIRIADDGRGIDPLKIREKLPTANRDEADEQVIQHVFDSGFSTRGEVSELSGRGVGLDAIRMAARKLGGDARVESKLGKGTTLVFELPG